MLLTGAVVFHIPGKLLGLQLAVPAVVAVCQLGAAGAQLALGHAQAANVQLHPLGQVAGAGAIAAFKGIEHLAPGINVQRGQAHHGGHGGGCIGAGRWHLNIAAQGNRAPLGLAIAAQLVAQLPAPLHHDVELAGAAPLGGGAHHQGQALGAVFVQRGGQLQGQPLQVAAHQHFRGPAACGHVHLVGAAALGVVGQLAHQGQWGLGLQAGCARQPLGLHFHAGLGVAHAAADAHAAAQGLGLHLVQGKAGVRKINAPLGLAQHRGVGREANLVALQLQLTLHLAFFNLGNGQLQLQLQLGQALGLGLGQGPAGQLLNGCALHGLQQGRQGGGVFGLHLHDGVVEVGNIGLNVCQLQRGNRPFGPGKAGAGIAHLHASPFKNQPSRQFLQNRPGRLAGWAQAAGHIVVGGIGNLRGNVKAPAMGGVTERHVPQVPLHGKAHIAAAPGQHAVAHVVAGAGGDFQGQVAVDAGAVGAAQLPA